MNIRRKAALFIGAITVLPIGFLAYAILFSPLSVLGTIEVDLITTFDRESFERFVGLVMIVNLWDLALVAFYLVYLFRSGRVRRSRQAGWAICLVLGNWFVMPVFWYLYLWRTPRSDVEADVAEQSPSGSPSRSGRAPE